MAEGTDTEVCVKFKPDQVVHKTPLIIIFNVRFDNNAPHNEKMAFCHSLQWISIQYS